VSKRFSNGSWIDNKSVKRLASGSWANVKNTKKMANGSWVTANLATAMQLTSYSGGANNATQAATYYNEGGDLVVGGGGSNGSSGTGWCAFFPAQPLKIGDVVEIDCSIIQNAGGGGNTGLTISVSDDSVNPFNAEYVYNNTTSININLSRALRSVTLTQNHSTAYILIVANGGGPAGGGGNSTARIYGIKINGVQVYDGSF
jgi:hypothetical protein